MSYKKIIAFLLFTRIFEANAQQEQIIPIVVPSAPASASLGSYGNVPIGLSTGKPNINLEIYTLDEAGIQIPITFNYASSGVQVDAVASQLGIDWNFNAGGAVTRTVRDEDDLKRSFHIPTQQGLADVCTTNSSTPITLMGTGVDTEKDIFSYSAMGVSGKFIFDGNVIRQIIPNQNKVEWLTDGPSLQYFKVTDPNGTEYYFGRGANSVEVSRSRNWCSQTHSNMEVADTAWYLTQIKTPNGQTAHFIYEQQNFDYIQSYFQSATKTVAEGHFYDSSSSSLGPLCPNRVGHLTSLLKEIIINDKKATFEYLLLEPNSLFIESRQLTKIKISEGTNIIKSFDVDYYVLNRNASPSFQNENTSPSKKSIHLKTVIENSGITAGLGTFSKYAFEYYSPELLAPQHSFAKDIYGYFNGKPNTSLIYNNLGPNDSRYANFSNVITDRDANPATVYYGMLKSITYPTKGKTEFVYEPNSVYISKRIYPPSLAADVGYSGQIGNYTLNSDPFTIAFNQECTLKMDVMFEFVTDGNCTYAEQHGADFILKIINTATNAVFKQVTVDEEMAEVFTLPAGTYKLQASSKGCVWTSAVLQYRAVEPYDVMVNDPVAGVRIQKTLDYDNTGTIQTKKYFYGDFNCLSCSSGTFSTINPRSQRNIDEFTVFNKHSKYTMYSSTVYPLNGADGSVLTYMSVIESFGENFENGGILHSFNPPMDETPIALCDMRKVRGISFSNSFAGQEEQTLWFKKVQNDYIPVKKEEYFYNYDESFDWSFDNYIGGIWTIFNNSSSSNPNFTWIETLYSFMNYQVRGKRYYMSAKKSTDYDLNGQEIMLSTTQFNYPTGKLGLFSQESSSSSAEILEKRFFYPSDAEVASEPNINGLISRNMIGTPLKTQSLKGSVLLAEQKTQYGSFASNTATPNLLPQYIFTKKSNEALDKKITYDYDKAGNIRQYRQENASDVTILWGYNGTLPIAKIENATFAQVLTALGTTEAAVATSTVAPTNIRQLLPNAMVTTYTHIPLIGVSSITDPKGDKMTYHYDAFGRLEFVKDKDTNILTENQYHYKN